MGFLSHAQSICFQLRQERDLYIYRSPIHLAAMMGDTGITFMQSLLQSPKVTNLNEVTIGDSKYLNNSTHYSKSSNYPEIQVLVVQN